MSIKCFVCFDTAKLSYNLFHCPGCMQFMCPTCFVNYITFCCNESPGSSKFPIKCPSTVCATLIIESEVKRLLYLNNDIKQNLWEVYVKASLRAALEEKPNEIPITCQKCGLYSELYKPLSVLEWDEKRKKREEVLRLEEEELRRQVEREAELKFQGDIVKYRYEVRLLKQQMLLLMGFDEDVKPILGNIAHAGLRGDAFEVFKQETEHIPFASSEMIDFDDFSPDFVIDFINNFTFQPLDIDHFNELKQLYRYISYLERKTQSQKLSLTAASQNLSFALESKSRFYQKEFQKRKTRLDTNKMDEELQYYVDKGALQTRNQRNHNLISLPPSSQYFICKRSECTGAYCLKCETFLEKHNVTLHLCTKDAISLLERDILNSLAESSSRRCPICGIPGRKDLECTVMTCTKCRSKYCYVCGKSEAQLEGGFLVHNQWTLRNGKGKCPLYLRYKYGEVFEGQRMNGNPADALQKFHLELQKKGIEKLKKGTDKQLWKECMRLKFPLGLFE